MLSLLAYCASARSAGHFAPGKYMLTISALHAEYYYDTGMSLGHHERHATRHDYLQARVMPALPLL